jgi:hypothetical protein
VRRDSELLPTYLSSQHPDSLDGLLRSPLQGFCDDPSLPARRLLLEAFLHAGAKRLIAFDGDEGFEMEAVEAAFYELVSAAPQELLDLERLQYRLLRRADDFRISGEVYPPIAAQSTRAPMAR